MYYKDIFFKGKPWNIIEQDKFAISPSHLEGDPRFLPQFEVLHCQVWIAGFKPL